MDVLVIEIIIAILRTLRVSRFIKTSAVVKTSSKVNWYWLPDRLSPRFWVRKCCGKGHKSTVGEGGILADLSDSAPLDLNNSLTMTTRSSALYSRNWHSSLSSTGSGVYEEGRGVGFAVNTFLHKFGAQNRRIKEFERQRAATKIQHAWREYREVTGKSSPRSKIISPAASKKSSKLESAKKLVLLRSRSSNASATPKDAEAVKESQVGSAMRELTGQRVVIGIVVALVLTVLFTYTEINSTAFSTMVVLHEQTQDTEYRNISLAAARKSAVPELFSYEDVNGVVTNYTLADGMNPLDLRPREILNISVTDVENMTSVGLFDMRQTIKDGALVELIDTIFILIIWFFGVTAFAGPVMTLVVTPIERMIRLLSMLVKDPLGYQGTSRYKKFVLEEDHYTKNTKWTKDVLKGMETSFLMSTILRIGSLMKVGFGAAGVEIIRQSLDQQSQDAQKHESIALNSKGSTVKCIFLFCDIRQFTDATESLQEEVFVFTNQIASVIHSICNSYGGSANKNVGDAFLMSWLLEDESKRKDRKPRSSSFVNSFDAQNVGMECQADKALYAVVRICIALYHDQYYIETLSAEARQRLLKKIGKRHGPVVQMGFGLHMGKAVQGAIGSERKLDATYISEAVEFAEFLESSTKQYGLKMLMSDAFYDILDPANRRRCRKIDQLFIPDEEEEGYLGGIELVDISEKIELYTYDMDVEATWRDSMDRAAARSRHEGGSESASEHDHSAVSMKSSYLLSSSRSGGTPTKKINRRIQMMKGSGVSNNSRREIRGAMGGSAPARPGAARRTSLLGIRNMKNSDGSREAAAALLSSDLLKRSPSLLEFDYAELNDRGVPSVMPPLVLPSSSAMYNPGVWNSKEIRKIRQRFSDGLFFQKFSEGLQAYYSKDWEQAKRCFRTILDRIEDGPSRYFMNQMDEHDGVPPRNFLPYGRV